MKKNQYPEVEFDLHGVALVACNVEFFPRVPPSWDGIDPPEQATVEWDKICLAVDLTRTEINNLIENHKAIDEALIRKLED